MDESKILILNLSKGRIGEDNSALLGAMMITKIQLASMSRVEMPELERKDFYLYIDEFQNFTTESFANILSEARKYRLNLILAHQYIEQLGDKVKAAVFGNVGTLVVFRVGAADAEELKPEFMPTFNEEDIVNLPKYEVYLKLMIDGIASEPFSARGLPPLPTTEETDNEDKVINVSRERYAKEREIVEDKITRWHESGGDSEDNNRKDKVKSKKNKKKLEDDKKKDNGDKNKKIEPRTKKDNEIYKYSAVCSRCGRETRISFQPDGIRPVYCKSCLSEIRQEKRDEIENRKKTKQEELNKLQAEEAISLNKAMTMEPTSFKNKEQESNKKNEFNPVNNQEIELKEDRAIEFN
jgi:CxxC-x17-CxxC domain-containing protein